MIRIPLLCLALCLSLSAQEGEVKKKGVQVRFVAQRLPAGLERVVMMAGEELVSEAFDLPLNNLSPRQGAPGRQFVLAPEGGKGALAKVSLPETGSDFIILLVLDKPPGFTPVILPAKDLSFKPGDVYMHNTSKSVILGEVGTAKFVVNPAKGLVVRPTGAVENAFYNVKIGVRGETGNRLLSTSRWPMDERVRSYVFFFDDAKRKDVDFRAVDEFVPLEEAE